MSCINAALYGLCACSYFTCLRNPSLQSYRCILMIKGAIPVLDAKFRSWKYIKSLLNSDTAIEKDLSLIDMLQRKLGNFSVSASEEAFCFQLGCVYKCVAYFCILLFYPMLFRIMLKKLLKPMPCSMLVFPSTEKPFQISARKKACWEIPEATLML